MGRVKSGCRDCRRAGEKLFLKGDRCVTEKCAFSRRKYPPGMHGAAPQRPTEYARRLREKQKARRIYGLTERQFRSYFEKATRKAGVTGEKLLEMLEMRLDNVVFRLGFAASRAAARQLVRHGHVSLNERKTNIPSCQVKVGDLVRLKPGPLAAVSEKLKEYTPPGWLTLTPESAGQVARAPSREDTERLIEESLIVEYYSR